MTKKKNSIISNRIYLVGLLSILMITFTACDNFLSNQPPKSFTSTDNFFKTQKQFQHAVNGVYSALQDFYSADGDFYLIAEERSDNTTFQYNAKDRGSSEHEKGDYFELYPSDPLVEHLWEPLYNIIAQSNIVLDKLEEVELDSDAEAKLSGQAKFVRALSYFYLVRLYGGVPLILKTVSSPSEAFSKAKRSTVDKVYAQIIQDAQSAAGNLPATWTEGIGRATKGAANTLLGLVYLTRKNYQDAFDTFDNVIGSQNYSLVSDYASLYNPSTQYNSEAIFQVGFSASVDGEASNYIYRFAPYNSGSSIVGFNDLTESGAGKNIPTPDMVKAYENGDKRKDASIAWYQDPENTKWGIAFGDKMPYINKYASKPTQPGKQDINFYVFRYAQVLLWQAETINEMNGPSGAYQYLNMVRQRAGLSGLHGLSQPQFRKAVYHEERVESAFEDHRWFQLLRTGRAIDVMTQHGDKMKNIQSWLPPTSYDIQSYKLLLPIPQRAIRVGKLSQNSGW